MARKKPKLLENRGGLRHHLNPRYPKARWTAERWAFILHRLTGIFLAVYLLAHIFVTSRVAQGQDAWEAIMSSIESNPLGVVGEWILWGVIVFHGLNGIRLILAEALGIGVGDPRRLKVPPEPESVYGKQRALLWIFVVLGFIAWIVGGLILFGEAGWL